MIEEARQLTVVARNLKFPEGPVALGDGTFLVAEIRGGTVARVQADGTVSVLSETGGGPNGMAIGPDRALFVCNNGGNAYPADHFAPIGPAPGYVGGSIQRVDLATGTCADLYTHCDGRRLSSPNDIVFDDRAGFYFTDSGKKHPHHRDHGAVYYARADGSHITRLANHVAAANGIGLSPDNRVLYVSETETSRLWAFDIAEPGVIARHPYPSPHGGRLVCGLPGYQRFDSLALDVEGNICVATLITGVVTVVAPDGRMLRQVKLPGTYVTNLCFGGSGLKTAYMTLSDLGQLVAVPWPVAGLPLNYNA